MTEKLSRREMVTQSGVCLAAGVAVAAPVRSALAAAGAESEPFGYCLNTATIRGQKLPADKEVEVAAKAGYQGIEPWVGNVVRYAEGGGSLADLKKRIADLGLTVESAIGFPRWIVDDDAQRAEGLEQMKRDMDTVRQIGGRRIAAPPAGAHGTSGMDLARLKREWGDRYTFLGNLDIRHALCSGTLEQARADMIRCIEHGWGDGGHVIMTSNVVHEDVRPELYREAVNAYRHYFGLQPCDWG